MIFFSLFFRVFLCVYHFYYGSKNFLLRNRIRKKILRAQEGETEEGTTYGYNHENAWAYKLVCNYHSNYHLL